MHSSYQGRRARRDRCRALRRIVLARATRMPPARKVHTPPRARDSFASACAPPLRTHARAPARPIRMRFGRQRDARAPPAHAHDTPPPPDALRASGCQRRTLPSQNWANAERQSALPWLAKVRLEAPQEFAPGHGSDADDSPDNTPHPPTRTRPQRGELCRAQGRLKQHDPSYAPPWADAPRACGRAMTEPSRATLRIAPLPLSTAERPPKGAPRSQLAPMSRVSSRQTACLAAYPSHAPGGAKTPCSARPRAMLELRQALHQLRTMPATEPGRRAA